MLVGSGFGDIAGTQPAIETFEQEFRWGHAYQMKYTNALISNSASDPTNTPTWELRMGLLMGLQTSTGQWVNYSPTATDGSQIAAGVIVEALRMQDVFTGNNTQKYWALCVGGNVRAAGLLGLDNYARQAMRQFTFDDDFPGKSWFDWKSFINVTANYQILASDNFTLFDNSGATGAVTLTLPAIANGYKFGLRCGAAQTFQFSSNEGNNLIGSTLTQSNASVTAIGGAILVFSNPGATKWIVVNQSSYNQVVSFS